MELWYAPTSPFARKVRISAHELGLDTQIQLRRVNPWTDPDLRKLNPLAKVPTFIADSGQVLYESSVICDYLDTLAPHRSLFPADGPERWRALLLQGLADGACTAAGRLFADENRPENRRDPSIMARLSRSVDATLDTMEAQNPHPESWTIGEVSTAAFLGYLDFRWPAHNWRARRPALALWHERSMTRPSIAATPYSL